MIQNSSMTENGSPSLIHRHLQGKPTPVRYLPALTWILALYIGTALTAGQAFVPPVTSEATIEQIKQAWFLFELKHVLLHAAAYGILVWLLALPMSVGFKRGRLVLMAYLLAMILMIGMGQEALQSMVRWHVGFANSMMDLASNTGGATLMLAAMAINRWR